MNEQILREIVLSTNENGKSIWAFDESSGTIKKRIESLELSQEVIEKNGWIEEIALLLRETQVETAGIINLWWVILAKDTMTQKTVSWETIPQKYRKNNVNVFYKADKWLDTETIPWHNITKWIEGLEEDLKIQKKNGANSAKWRALFNVRAPDWVIERNCEDLAEYARICQSLNIVPIVEPEVFLEWDYSIEEAKTFNKKVLDVLFKKLKDFDVYLPGIILKPSFISVWSQYPEASNPELIWKHTWNILRSLPNNISVNFLSWGHSFTTCVKVLNILNNSNIDINAISASFGRWLSGDKNEWYLHYMKLYLETGDEAYKEQAKNALIERANIIKDARTLSIDSFQQKYPHF